MNQKELEEKVKCCSFCKLKPIAVKVYKSKNFFDLTGEFAGYQITCIDCGIKTKTYKTIENAIKSWNNNKIQ